MFDSCQYDEEDKSREQEEPELHADGGSNEFRKISVFCQLQGASPEIFRQIFEHPAADDAIIRNDEHGDDSVDPSPDLKGQRAAEGVEGTYRALPGHASQSSLRYDQGVAEGDHQDQIDQKEHTAAVFGGKVRKTPDIAKSHCRACHSQYVAQAS